MAPLICGNEITLPSSTTARSSSPDWVLPYWLNIFVVRLPNAVVPAPLKFRFTCQKVLPCCREALAFLIWLPSTRDLSSANLYITPLSDPQDTIWRCGSFQTCGVYPIFCCQFLSAQLTSLNSFFTCGLTSVGCPRAVCQVEVPFADVGTGDGVAAGVAAADGLPVADGVGLGLAAAVSAAALPPRLRALRAISATPLCAAPRTKALVDGLGEAFAFGVALADGLGEPVAVELGVGVGADVAWF